MRIIEIPRLLLLMPLAAVGCGIDLGPYEDEQPSAPCGAASCAPAPPPESVCRGYLTADQAEDGCGVFVDGFGGDDENPGTRDKPVQSLPRGVALARTGRGRVFLCSRHSGAITLPSGVDLVGSFDCTNDWKRRNPSDDPIISSFPVGVALTIEPARPDDTGAADGVSTLVNVRIGTTEDVGLLARSGSAVEIVRSELFGSPRYRAADDARTLPDPPEGAPGNGGVQGCSVAPAAGGAPAMSSCHDGAVTIGGKGGDGGATASGDGGDAGDGGDGVPAPGPDASPDDRRWGAGGTGDHGDGRCQDGQPGKDGAPGVDGAPGQGIGRLSENGWIGSRAWEGSRGRPGQGGGGGGGLRGSAALCGVASRSGPSGGSGGGGGCGGNGGKGGSNGIPSIAILALHAKVTVRDSLIGTGPAMPGADGGAPQDGSRGGRGGIGAYSPDAIARACDGGDGGLGGPGGYGGGGRGGDSIGIAHLDDTELVLENVTFELGEPGAGGIGNPADPATWGEDGIAVEALRFPE
ncbi:hypothetical protein BE21_08410 [Sorangium cellulosum]|uniref:PE-PGRS family protein n=1 Tax=Sorangium cellulosum TaxID=56 RepID=A0A150U2M1_SORCE|nr:hypothetical protein BE21_08410 [Sorangium cellulosum]